MLGRFVDHFRMPNAFKNGLRYRMSFWMWTRCGCCFCGISMAECGGSLWRIIGGCIEVHIFLNQVISDASVQRLLPLIFIALLYFQNFKTYSSWMRRCSFWEIWGSLRFQCCSSACAWAAFSELWGSLGLNFSSLGCLQGCILDTLGFIWAPFWPISGLRGALGIPRPPLYSPKSNFKFQKP